MVTTAEQGVGLPTQNTGLVVPGPNAIKPTETPAQSETQVFDPVAERVIELDLNTASTNQLEEFAGTVIYYAAAYNGNTVIVNSVLHIRFDDESNPEVPVIPGMMISGREFQRMFIRRDATGTAGDTGKLLIYFDRPDQRILIE